MSTCVSVGANVINLVRVPMGVIDPDAVEDVLDRSSSTSSFGSSATASTRSRGMANGDAGSGDLTSSEGPAVGEDGREWGTFVCFVAWPKMFSSKSVSWVGTRSSTYCRNRDQHRASSVLPATRATFYQPKAFDKTYLSIPPTKLLRVTSFNLVMIRQIGKLVIIKHWKIQCSQSL